MTMQSQTVPMRAPNRTGLRAVLAVGVALALAGGIAVWQAGRDGGSGSSVSQPTAPIEQPLTTRGVDTAPTLYLAATQAQADAVQAGIADADAIRAQIGESPLNQQVLVVGSMSEDGLHAALAEQDAIRAGLGLSGFKIVDLRPSAASDEGLCTLDRQSRAC